MLMTTRLSFLQQVQKSAISGYFYHTSIILDIEKLPSLIKKFSAKYQINQTRQQAYRKRQKGEASAKFFCYADETNMMGTKVFCVLMFTQGQTSADKDEQLKDLRIKKQRFQYSDYQLIQKPRPDGKQRFTFQIAHESFSYYQDKLRKSIRNKNVYEINKQITHLSLMPGFATIRKQKKSLNSLIKGELNKNLKPIEKDKVNKMTNFYHRQQKADHVIRLAFFIQQMQTRDLTVKAQLKIYRDNKSKRATKKTEIDFHDNETQPIEKHTSITDFLHKSKNLFKRPS